MTWSLTPTYNFTTTPHKSRLTLARLSSCLLSSSSASSCGRYNCKKSREFTARKCTVRCKVIDWGPSKIKFESKMMVLGGGFKSASPPSMLFKLSYWPTWNRTGACFWGYWSFLPLLYTFSLTWALVSKNVFVVTLDMVIYDQAYFKFIHLLSTHVPPFWHCSAGALQLFPEIFHKRQLKRISTSHRTGMDQVKLLRQLRMFKHVNHVNQKSQHVNKVACNYKLSHL